MAFKVDLHTHTRFGSNCSYTDPADLASRAGQVGLSGICITEHNAAWDDDQLAALGTANSVVLFPGIEVSTELGDILVYGIGSLAVAGWRAARLRRRVRAEGGYMVAAHPFRRFSWPGAWPVEEALASPVFRFVDAVEVFNGMSSPRELELALEIVPRLGLPGVGGSDSHAPHTVGRCYTEFQRPLRTAGDLVQELKAGRFRAVHALMDLTY